MSEEAKKWLEKYEPDVLKENTVKGALRKLSDAIDFDINERYLAPPDYYDYTDLGREAQWVYDDILYYREVVNAKDK